MLETDKTPPPVIDKRSRPWYRKKRFIIPVLLFIGYVATHSNNSDSSKPAAQPVASTTPPAAPAAPTPPTPPAPPKPADDGSSTVSPDYVKNIVVKDLGDKNNDGDKPKVVDVQSNDDGADGVKPGQKIVILTLNANSNLTNDMTHKGMWMDTIPVMRDLFKNPKVEEVNIDWQLPLTDTYGNTKDGKVMSVKFTRPQASKINWDNFLYDNVPVVSKASGYYWEHPALSK